MAKKSISAASAASNEAPKKVREIKLNARVKLEYFWDYADLSWTYCDQNLDRISLLAPYITKEYVAQQVAFIAEVKQLPNNGVRNSNNTKSLLSVRAKRQAVLENANLLDAALKVFTQDAPALYPVERKAAGLVAFREASDSNYPAVSTFITTANNYLAANGKQMVAAKVLPADFEQRFKDAGTDFDTAKKGLNAERQTSKGGTSTVAAGVDKIKQQLGLMQGFGKQAFRYEPELLKLFTEDYLLEAVRSRHPAGLDGTTALPPADGNIKGKPLANILVEVLDMPGKSALTNKRGRYIIKQLAAGGYMVRYSGEGIATVVQQVMLDPGISRRVDVTLEPAPPVAAEERTVAASSLSNAVSELLVDMPKATNGVHEAAAA